MCRPPSPIFDVPELPTLRRVKPLPKRRRMSDPVSQHGDLHTNAGGNGNATAPSPGSKEQDHEHPGGTATSAKSTTTAAGEDKASTPAPDPTLTAQRALQAYYHPVLGGVRDLFKHVGPGAEAGSRTSTPIDLSSALAAGVLGYGGGGNGDGGREDGYGYADGGEEDEEEGGDGDYVDHLQQPGNTKKRKVPANMSGSAHGHDGGDSGSGAEDEAGDRSLERDGDAVSGLGAGGGAGSGGGGGGAGGGGTRGGGLGSGLGKGKKGRLSRATVAGLQHKELLKSRKRLLAAVLGSLPQGDTLALDQALSADALFMRAQAQAQAQLHAGPGNAALPPPPRVRLSRRRVPRVARAIKAYKESHPHEQSDENEGPAAVPSDEFSFVFNSATSDRLAATKQEVTELHSRFEAELARQAAKAAEAAKQAAAALSGPLAKRTDRSKQATRTSGGKNTTTSIDGQKGTLEQSLLGTKGKGGKKKKRSALANASNPHHLRNYVPSRLPHSGPPSAQQAVQNAQNLLTPLPLRFLSAEIPPRRRKKREEEANTVVAPVAATLTNPGDEWICPFCEYELFYGEEQSYARAVRNRKKILRRRRRARERAAAAASGVAAPAAGSERTEEEEDVGGFETAAAAKEGNGSGKQAKWGDGGGHAVAADG